jgi:NAD(P)-dependent dehydrogenase (short-subunit alcohol dehydrogenase family)
MPAVKTAIVTGANRGIGLEIARQLVKEGVRVVLGSRDPAKGEQACASLKAGDLAVSHALDVTDTKSVQRLVKFVHREFGAPAILVNNAGVYPESSDAKVTEVKTALWRETFETNLFGAVRLCREVIPLMQRVAYGRVVNMSSGLGQLSKMGAGGPAYRVSKAALNALTATLAAEVIGQGILVNAMSPGWVRTDMGGPDAPRGVAEGADTAVWLALLPSNGPTGGFFRDRKPIPW